MAVEKKEQYVECLEEELKASLERERLLSNENISFAGFIGKKIKKTGLYKNIISNPNSRMGKIARAPRTLLRRIKNPEIKEDLSQKKTANELIKKYDIKNSHLLDPWNISLKERKEVALNAIKDGKKLALYFVEKPDSSTFRYRCFNTYEATLDSKKWQAVFFLKNEVEIVKELLPKSSLLIYGRMSGQEKTVAKLTEIAHENNIKVGLDIDDLVFDKKYLDVVLNTINGNNNRGYWIVYFNSVRFMAESVDFFVTTNDFIADKLKASFGKPCTVIRNSLNNGQVNASVVYRMRKERSDGLFRIGYFSGSPTHANDFAVAEPELIRFLEDHDDAVLNVVGYMRFSRKADKLVKRKRIVFLPLVDFRKLQRMMAEVDVNIAPLLINDFTNCKSELKFFESAIVETTTIASPSFTFKNAITDGKNGFLANPGEWYKKLEYLYKHPEENKKIAKAAKEYAMKHYYGDEFRKEVEEAYDRFAK